MKKVSARLLQQRPGRPTHSAPSPRERIASHCRDQVRGVDARTAHARMAGFYRSSGLAWARSLV